MTNWCRWVRRGSARWLVLHCGRVHQTAGRDRQESVRDCHPGPTARELQVPAACKHEQPRVTWKLLHLLSRHLKLRQPALVMVHSETAQVEDAGVSWPPTRPHAGVHGPERELKAAAMATPPDVATAVQRKACWQAVLHMPGGGTQGSEAGAVLAGAHHRRASQAAA